MHTQMPPYKKKGKEQAGLSEEMSLKKRREFIKDC